MAQIEHVDIADPQIHEPKGVAAANANEVYIADGAGSGSYDIPEVLGDGWRDLFGCFTAAKLTGSNQPTWAQVTDDGASSTGVYAYSFSPTVLNELWLSFHINHDYKDGTAFYPHLHWLPTDTNTGTVRWGIEWVAAMGHNQASFGTTTTTYLEQAAPGTALQHMIIEQASPGITVPNAEPDMVILARVFRDAAHANDTYTGSVFGLQLDAHYQIDRLATINKEPPFYT